jgi:hypothetical protein
MLVKVAAYLRKNHIALLALFFALGGTSFAAAEKFVLPKNSVGTRQLRKNAVISSKIKNNQVLGADVRESSLSKVPQAGHADSADNAGKAASAINARNAANAANAAALGGTAASSYETKDEATARTGRFFVNRGFVTSSVTQQTISTVPGLGTLEVLCSASGNGMSVDYKNTIQAPHRVWEEDDVGDPAKGNGIMRVLLNPNDKLTANGFNPDETTADVTAQVSTWMIDDALDTRFATVHVAMSRFHDTCYYMVDGRVTG